MPEIRDETFEKARSASAPERPPLWARGFSLEATVLEPEHVERLKGALEPGTEIYLSALARISHDDQIVAAERLGRAGFEPLLHVAARRLTGESDLAALLERAAAAGVRKCLIVAGDGTAARGPFASSLDVIRAPVLAAAPLVEIGIGGYPEGHPYVAADKLDRWMEEKLEAIRRIGMVPFVVSQFCFDAAKILHWLSWLRTFEPNLPVQIGVAGPVDEATLTKVALRCGVDLPWAQGKPTPQDLRQAAPDRLVAALEDGLKAQHETGPVRLHFHSFGDAVQTGLWARAAAQAALLARS